jgi:hypothetical protein
VAPETILWKPGDFNVHSACLLYKRPYGGGEQKYATTRTLKFQSVRVFEGTQIFLKEGTMKEVHNANGKLVAAIDEATGTVVIVRRGCITRLRLKSDGTVEIINTKANEAE